MQAIVGSCPRCGAPIYGPGVWMGIGPPPSTPSCGCFPSAPTTLGSSSSDYVGSVRVGFSEDAPPTPAPAADPSPQPPANPAPPPPPPEAPDAGNVDAMCAGISEMARHFAGVDPSQHQAGWAETQLLEAQPIRELHSRELECMRILEGLDDEARERVLTWGVNRWPVARDFVVHVDCMHKPSKVAEAVIDEVARRAEAYTKGAGQ